MKFGSVPGIDIPVSRLVQGTVMINSGDLEGSFSLLDRVFEMGCNTFDTAHIYGGGDNERTVGLWVRDRGIRDQVVIIAKGAHHNADRKRVTPFDITADLHDSLARFQFDSLDLYLLHRDDPDVPVGPIVEVLNEHLRAGRVRAFGGSNWSHERIREANQYAEENGLVQFAASSPQFSLAEQVEEPWEDCLSISGPSHREAREWYQQQGMPIFAWSSLAAGFFSGRFSRENLDSFEDDAFAMLSIRCYASEENFKRLDRVQELARQKGLTPTQIALAWVLNQPLNVFPLVGCVSENEFREAVEALDVELTAEELRWINLEG